jgi:FtsP/CotA-like multicopper oxidase with cupredoxin domain
VDETARPGALDEHRPAKKMLPRRHLLGGGTALGGYLLLPSAADAQHRHPPSPAPSPVQQAQAPPRPAARPHHDHSAMGLDPGPVVEAAPPAMDQPLVEPEVRRSADGVLQHHPALCRYAWQATSAGGGSTSAATKACCSAPTLRMKPGETLKIRLTNDIPPNRDSDAQATSWRYPHQFNNTNFHFHGAHCSPSGIADNVMRTMLPGQDLRHRDHAARRTIRAAPTGTIRTTTARADVQVASGMVRRHRRRGRFRLDVPEIAAATRARHAACRRSCSTPPA